jgi:hypothetical protein
MIRPVSRDEECHITTSKWKTRLVEMQGLVPLDVNIHVRPFLDSVHETRQQWEIEVDWRKFASTGSYVIGMSGVQSQLRSTVVDNVAQLFSGDDSSIRKKTGHRLQATGLSPQGGPRRAGGSKRDIILDFSSVLLGREKRSDFGS